MGFQQGLSGLNVSSKSLDAIGNNIANASTVGYKSSAVQFADVYAAALGGGGAGQIGIGASAPSIAQLFTQGNVTTTNNPLDIAINGGGFFRLSDGGSAVYSRNGQFSLDKDGYIVNPAGLRLTGYGANENGAIVPGDFVDLRMTTTNIAPSETTSSEVVVNLDSRSSVPASMTSGRLVGDTIPTFPLDITAANNEFDLVVDGIPASQPISVPIRQYLTIGELADAVETAINADPALTAANALVDVEPGESGLVITSRSAGSVGSNGYGSNVIATAVAGDTGLADMFGVPVPSSGIDNFSVTNTQSYTASTAQTVYDSLGNPHNLTMFFVKTSQANVWQFYTTLDNGSGPTAGTATGSIPHTNLTAGAITAADTFTVSVDGIASGTITPEATGYPNPAAMAADLESKINADPALLAAGKAVSVTLDSAGNIVVASATIGVGSTVAITGGDDIFGTTTTALAGTGTAPVQLVFEPTGALRTQMPLQQSFLLNNGAVPQFDFTLDLTGSSQYGINFGVNQLLQDGYTSGRLTGISVAPDGTVQGRYSNGKTRDQGQIVLVNFNNPNGLQSLGGNVWAETSESGQPIPGTPGQGSLGLLQSAAVEESNVDLTAELVAMIMQQRVYQANAQTIKTQDQVLQTLVNLR